MCKIERKKIASTDAVALRKSREILKGKAGHAPTPSLMMKR